MPGVYSSKQNLLFDLDGTLVDSTRAHARAFMETLQIEHPDLAENFQYAAIAGWPTREVFQKMGVRDEHTLTELTARKQALYRATVERGEIEIFSGAVPLLERLHELKRSLFLVTGASRASTQRVLTITGLAPYFQSITTAEDATPGKPSPEPYRQTLIRNGLKAAESLAIEDAESGARSAQAAGVEVVLIHAGFFLPGVVQVRNYIELGALLLP